jgi:hypothetical protein
MGITTMILKPRLALILCDLKQHHKKVADNVGVVLQIKPELGQIQVVIGMSGEGRFLAEGFLDRVLGNAQSLDEVGKEKEVKPRVLG